jgi:hypothetical protein
MAKIEGTEMNNKQKMKEEAKKAYLWGDYHAITNKIKGISD